jgi:EAL domain-containing protein (putative c-di-GMP-specific phosphodiesterase class I)
MVAATLTRAGLEPDRLGLEITESAMMRDPGETLATLRELKALGPRILMDDFGTGYASLACLRTFPFDKVKLDRSCVRDIDQPTSLATIRAVTGIAESLSIRTIVEGVETEAQFRRVAAEGCDEAQGFLFSKAIPPSEIAALSTAPQPVLAAA